jgi:predicted dehydrogenase
VNVNWLSPTKIRTTVIGGARRTIVWDDLNTSARLMIHDRGVDLLSAESVAPDERAQALIAYRTGDASVPALPEYEALRSVMSEFAGAITEGRRPLTDVWAGLRVLAVLAAASQSVDKDGIRVPVEMPVETEESG